MFAALHRRPIIQLLSALAVAAAPFGASASLPPLADEIFEEERLVASPLVRRAQGALSKLGLYLGPEDGRLTEATKAAIKVYQRANRIRPDGQVTRKLVGKLEYAVGVRRLMRQLEKARAESIDDARSKLMSHPATRGLVEQGLVAEKADPTRDVSACFDDPTALCLLSEAVESAKAISRKQLRNWALGEILIAQARAGLGREAMETAAKINDPRLVMVALRDIAEAQAASGRHHEARTAADIIPDPEKQADALAAIAEIQLRRGDGDVARETAEHLIDTLGDVNDPLKQIAYRTRVAVIYAQSGDDAAAENELTVSELLARGLPEDSSRSAGLRHVASALADMEETGRALELLGAVSSPSDKIPVLMSASEAQARAGDAAAALATASNIESVRYRAVALGRIALAQAEAGDLEDADTTLETALAAIDRIERPYARSFAISRIVMAMARLRDLSGPDDRTDGGREAAIARAIELTDRIDDRRLKAYTLWLISTRQQDAGDDGWKTTEKRAEAATEEIVGALSRVWMFADIAEGHAANGESKAAWQAFDHGIRIARTVDNAWTRARTMAKLAGTLIRLVDPGRGSLIDDP